MNLNHPYYIYPNGPLSEYTNYSLYNKEVVRFKNYLDNLTDRIDNLKSDPNVFILTPFIIGSTMENSIINKYNDSDTFFQWQQLFPVYINNFIDLYKNNHNYFIHINIIIVSPDNTFNDEKYHDPIFTLLDYFPYKFSKISNRKYEYISESDQSESNQSDKNIPNHQNNSGSRILKITIDIFNCPLPSLDIRYDIMDKLDILINKYESSFDNLDIKSFRQTNADIEFINNFYESVDKLFKKVDYKKFSLIINSWATFKNLTGFNRYTMFNQLLNLANDNNILATEWNYDDKNFLIEVISRFITQGKGCIFKKIVYIDENYCNFNIKNKLVSGLKYDYNILVFYINFTHNGLVLDVYD